MGLCSCGSVVNRVRVEIHRQSLTSSVGDGLNGRVQMS